MHALAARDLEHARDDVLLRAHLAERVDEAAGGVHEVEEDGVVDEVVVRRPRVGRRGEVDAVRLARRLERRVVAREAEQARVEVGDVARDLGGGVACRVDGDEDRVESGRTVRGVCMARSAG